MTTTWLTDARPWLVLLAMTTSVLTPSPGVARAPVPQLAHGSPPPAGTLWVMSAAGACNRPLPDNIAIDPNASLDYGGGTPTDVMRDAVTHGAQWRMAAVAADGRTIKAITVWCSPPAPAAAPASATASGMEGLRLCRCRPPHSPDSRDTPDHQPNQGGPT